MSEIRQFRQNDQIVNGITAETNLKMFDIFPAQHENLATNTNKQVKISIAQALCEPVAVCSTNNPQNGQYTATCVNFPDFATSFVDSNSVRHNLVGLKLRVIFEHGITYGSVASGTFPTLSVNGSEALPLLAQGKTMAQGAIVAGQSVEFTIIPYGNSIAFDADSNVRENTNDYTIYTDGAIVYNGRRAPFDEKASSAVSSFIELTGQSIINSASVADYFRTYIADYPNGYVFSKSMGGPSYEGIIFKYANNYFSIVICGYATYGGIEIFTFSGGLYMYKNIAAAL